MAVGREGALSRLGAHHRQQKQKGKHVQGRQQRPHEGELQGPESGAGERAGQRALRQRKREQPERVAPKPGPDERDQKRRGKAHEQKQKAAHAWSVGAPSSRPILFAPPASAANPAGTTTRV